MKKRIAASLMVIVMAIGCFTGCTPVKGFSFSGFTGAMKDFGLTKVWTTFDKDKMLSELTDDSKPSCYIESEDKEEAQYFYDHYINPTAPEKFKIKKIAIAAAREKPVNNRYVSTLYLIEFETSSDAEKDYNRISYNLREKQHFEIGDKWGYKYTISYHETRAYNALDGAYLCGNKLLILLTLSSKANDKGIATKVFKKLGVEDPAKLA